MIREDAIDRFRRTFEVTGGQLLVSDEAEPLGEGEAAQESVARYRPQPEASSDTAAATAEGVGLSDAGGDASGGTSAEGGE